MFITKKKFKEIIDKIEKNTVYWYGILSNQLEEFLDRQGVIKVNIDKCFSAKIGRAHV